MFAACMNMCMGHFKQRMRSLTVTLALVLAGIAVVLVAAGFGLSLLTVWLQQIYGTMPALAIVGGGSAGLGLILFLTAFLRSASRPRQVRRDAAISGGTTAGGAIDEAIASVEHGSREKMLAALVLAVVAGVTLGRKL
jgi:hypothetical protein